MTVSLCDRCGDVTVAPAVCRCHTPYNAVEVRRRLRDAVRRAGETDRLRAGRRRVA